MLSFQTLYNICVRDASDPSNVQYFKDRINEAAKIAENELDDFVVEDQRTGNTIAGFNQIPTPENYVRGKFLYVTSGSNRYDATFVYSEEQWQKLVAFQQNNKSNYLEYAFPRIDYVELLPAPSSILPYTFQYVSEQRDMQFDDYTTPGTAASFATTTPTNALPFSTFTLTGETLTANMAGRYFKMNQDNQWYKITSVTVASHLVQLNKVYQGLAPSVLPSATFTIAEMPRLPEAIHFILPFFALHRYYMGVKKDTVKQKMYGDLWAKWLTWGKGTFANRTEMGVIPSQRNLRRSGARNPNLFPMGISGH
jgi:hypothetical protein